MHCILVLDLIIRFVSSSSTLWSTLSFSSALLSSSTLSFGLACHQGLMQIRGNMKIYFFVNFVTSTVVVDVPSSKSSLSSTLDNFSSSPSLGPACSGHLSWRCLSYLGCRLQTLPLTVACSLSSLLNESN